MSSRVASILTTLAGVFVAWIAFDLLVWAYGESPRELAVLVFQGTWGTAYGAGQVLFKATPLLFAGVAVQLALRAGLFNIGAEGQLTIGSLVAAVLAARISPTVPPIVAIPLVVLAAMFAGAMWAAIPALLRARFGAHEVISTIMMNRIADATVGLAFASGLALAGTIRTAPIRDAAKVPRLEAVFSAFHGSAVSFAIVFAIAVAFVALWWQKRSRLGREMTLVGGNAAACAAEGIPVARRLALALLLSGAIAALGSTGTVLGYKGYYELGLGAGAGFGGIAVALLGRGSALGLLLAALLFGTLAQGGLAINAYVPMEMMEVLQAIVIVAVALGDTRIRAQISRELLAPLLRRKEATS
jgi:simple sugar transport system permease protein